MHCELIVAFRVSTTMCILMCLYHIYVVGVHYGIERTACRLQDRYYWVGIIQYLRAYIRGCGYCQARNIANESINLRTKRGHAPASNPASNPASTTTNTADGTSAEGGIILAHDNASIEGTTYLEGVSTADIYTSINVAEGGVIQVAEGGIIQVSEGGAIQVSEAELVKEEPEDEEATPSDFQLHEEDTPPAFFWQKVSDRISFNLCGCDQE